jgi:hypothetical protein
MWNLAIPIIGQLLDKILPDAGARDAAKLELMKAQQSGELAQIMGQLDINKEEAKSQSLFVSGWRPSVGWCCSLALAYQFLIRPISTGLGHEMPAIDTEALSTLLYALLGVAGLRSVEKIKGAA